MPTPARTRHIRGIDGLRALAAFAVVAHHVGFDTGATFRTSAGAVLARLDIGVPIFFAISGYLLGRSFIAALVDRAPFSSFRSFWWRRLVRIYPAYWFVLTLLVLVAGIKIESLYQFVVFYGLFQIYDKDLALKGMVQAWTLCTEISFYAVLPLLALAARRMMRRLERPEARLKALLAGCAGLYLVGVVWRLFLFTVDPPWGRAGLLWLPGQIDYFALGLAVAVVGVAAGRDPVVAERVRTLVARPGIWFLAALALFAVVCSLGLTRTVQPASVPLELDGGEMVRQLLYGLVSVLLLIPLALAPRSVGSARVIFGTRTAAQLGLLSYGIYLWHKDLIPKAQLWAGDALFQGNFWQIFVIVAVASTALAGLTYLTVEQPSLQWTRPREQRDATAWQRLVTTAAVARERMSTVAAPPTTPELPRAAAPLDGPRRRRVPGWWLGVLAVVVVGFVVRLAYFWFAQRNAYVCPPSDLLGCAGDGYVYHTSANLLADGRGFISPLGLLSGNVFPSADHPPFYIVYLAGFSALGLDTYRWHQFATVLLGTVSIPVAGGIGVLLGRSLGERGLRGIVATPWLGVATAAAVAFAPAVWLNDGLLLSESTVVLTVLLAALAAISFWRSPTTGRALLLGAACGLRRWPGRRPLSLVPLVGFPLALLTIRRRPAAGRAPVDDLRRRSVLAGSILVASLLVVAPWVVRNFTTFERPTGLSTGLGVTMAYSNCDRTYYGDLVGFWWFDCKGDVDLQADVDQSVVDARLRTQAVDYIRSHPARAPVVVLARAGRVWGVYQPNQVAYLETFEGRPLWAARASLLALYPIVALAVVAAALLRRYRTVVLPLVAPAVVVTVAVMLTFGQPRYRATADGALAVLAGIGAARVVDVLRNRRREPTARRAVLGVPIGRAPRPGEEPRFHGRAQIRGQRRREGVGQRAGALGAQVQQVVLAQGQAVGAGRRGEPVRPGEGLGRVDEVAEGVALDDPPGDVVEPDDAGAGLRIADGWHRQPVDVGSPRGEDAHGVAHLGGVPVRPAGVGRVDGDAVDDLGLGVVDPEGDRHDRGLEGAHVLGPQRPPITPLRPAQGEAPVRVVLDDGRSEGVGRGGHGRGGVPHQTVPEQQQAQGLGLGGSDQLGGGPARGRRRGGRRRGGRRRPGDVGVAGAGAHPAAPRQRTATTSITAVRDRRRWLLLVLPLVIGLVIRLVYLWAVHRTQCPAPWWDDPTAPRDLTGRCPGDSYVYHYGADLLARGHGFVIPTDFRASGGLVAKAGADHPPLFTLLLAAFSFVGAGSWLWHEHVVIALGIVNIALTGMLGRRVAARFLDQRAADWVGFTAATLMAVYPYVWLSDVMVLSETLAMTANLAVALLCYRVLRDQSWGWIVALGVAAAAAALVRAEMVLLGPFVIVPMLLRIRSLSFAQQLARIAVAGVVMLGVLTPWLYRNMTVYNHPVTMSTGPGITLANTNCDDTYQGGGMGFWSFACIPPLPWTRPEAELRSTDPATLRLWVDQSGISAPPAATPDELVDLLLDHAATADQSDDEVYLRAVGLDYLTDNLGRLPVVAAARVGRMWGLYQPIQQLSLENGEGRPEDAARFGLAMFYPLMVLAVGGAVVLARRRQPLLPLLVPIGIVTFAAVTAFGQSRYRAPAEPLLMVLAATGAVVLVRWVRQRRNPADGAPPEVEQAAAAP